MGIYFENETFEKLEGLDGEEYEGCSFIDCNFAGADFSEKVFSECEFIGCNLSTAKLIDTALRDISFKNCKMLGLHFTTCNDFLFAVRFEECVLDMCLFMDRRLKETVFKASTLRDADFTDADLTAAVFEDCDLTKATFVNTILEKADLRSSYNYSLDPELNRIRGARFSSLGLAGLLGKYEIFID